MAHVIKILPNDHQNRTVLYLLRGITLFMLFRAVFEFYRFSVWKKIYSGINITLRQRSLVEWIEWISLGVQLVLFIICLIFFLRWMHRAYQNLKELDVYESKRSLDWVYWGWFVPGLNFIVPNAIIRELILWNEAFLISRKYIRKDTTRNSLRAWWWFTLQAGIVSLPLSFLDGIEGYMCAALSAVFFFISGIIGMTMMGIMKTLEDGVRDQKDIHVAMPHKGDLLDN